MRIFLAITVTLSSWRQQSMPNDENNYLHANVPCAKKIGFDTLNPKPLRMETRDVHISKGCVIKSEVDDDWRELVSTNIGPLQTCTAAILSLSGECESVSNLIKTKSQKY